MKNLLLAAVLSMAATSAPVALADSKVGTTENFQACSALKDEDAYKKHDGFRYIIPGKDGWFFRTSQDLKTDFEISQPNLDLFRHVTDGLKAKGIDLIIAYAPTRGMAAASMLPDEHMHLNDYDAAKARASYAALITKMNQSGVHMVGTPDIKSGPDYFYKADLHWTSDGAKEMAQAVAHYAKKLPSYAGLTKTAYKNVALPDALDEQKFNSPLQAICGMRTAPEMAHLNKTVAVGGGETADALLGDAPLPQVVLVGTSNSNRDDNDLNFAGRLKEFLSADVLNAAVAGGGLDDAMLAYLASSEFKKSPPKIMVWELPGYYNLDGNETPPLLREIWAAIHGPCPSPLAAVENVKLDDKTTLFENLGTKIDASKPFYLAGHFSKEENKKIEILFTYDSGKEEKFKLKKMRAYPKDNSFYYAPKNQPGHLNAVTIKVPDGAATVSAKICALPD